MSTRFAPRWMMFCEARGDFDTVSHLVDELLLFWGSSWVRDAFERDRGDVRRWWRHDSPVEWYDIHKVYEVANELSIKPHHGHFGGEPALPGAVMLETIFRIVRAVWRANAQKEPPSAVVVVWDADDQGPQRRNGFVQARNASATIPSAVKPILAIAEPEREAWVLAGFEPQTEEESLALQACRAELGFHPHENAHLLGSGKDTAKTDSKRVLRLLHCADREREKECLRIGEPRRRERLIQRGEHSGLRSFILDIEQHLLPQVDSGIAARLPSERP